ncbi:MAG: phage portal protein [Lachnospiraceae bacterium]|nr:phage portal protein [Clostridia bacterium]MBR0085654.1 phage portal protein [Lachnospiraceae bacterium]
MHKTKTPYKIPAPLTCDPRDIENGVSMELVRKYIKKHEGYLRRYEYLGNLYKGFHDVYLEPEKEDWKPDNRLAVNFPRYMTETFAGYGYGIPIQVTHEDDAVNEAVQGFGKNNEISDHDAEMVKLCCEYGHGWEYLYQDEEANTKISAFTPIELFTVYDDTIKNRALFSIRYGRHDYESDRPGEEYGEVMTAEEIKNFDNGAFTEVKDNPYGYIPVVEWKLNDERIGLYENVAGLIEAYNHTIGEKANDVDAFAEAYLAVMGAKLEDDQVYHIRDDRLINIYGTDNAKDILVQFLQKPTADGTQEHLLDRLQDHIYETSMVANISDDTFGSSTSGVSLAYKLQAMSNLALAFDRKIEKSLRKRYKIWSSLSTNTTDKDMWQEIDIRFTRNLPKNLKEEAEVASQLGGVVSKETQLSVMPSIVPDVSVELERLDEEKKESAALTGMFAEEVTDDE